MLARGQCAPIDHAGGNLCGQSQSHGLRASLCGAGAGESGLFACFQNTEQIRVPARSEIAAKADPVGIEIDPRRQVGAKLVRICAAATNRSVRAHLRHTRCARSARSGACCFNAGQCFGEAWRIGLGGIIQYLEGLIFARQERGKRTRNCPVRRIGKALRKLGRRRRDLGRWPRNTSCNTCSQQQCRKESKPSLHSLCSFAGINASTC